MIFLLRSRHLGSPVQSSLEPCCTAGTTPSCAGAARFNVRRRAAAAAKWHRVNMDGSSATISKRARGANLRAEGDFLDYIRRPACPSAPAGRAVPALGTRWCQGKDAHAWRACCCSTALPRKFVAHRRRRAPTRTATASSGRRWASARTTRASCVLQCGKQARARPSGSLEACLQCHGAPQAARSSGQPGPISRSVLAISPDRACLRRRHLTCALTCGTCAKQRARGRRHECSDIGADAHVEGDVTAIMERLEQRTELGPEVLSPPLPPWPGPPPPPQPQPQPRTLSCCLLARASARSVHLKALHYPRPRCSRATRG